MARGFYKQCRAGGHAAVRRACYAGRPKLEASGGRLGETSIREAREKTPSVRLGLFTTLIFGGAVCHGRMCVPNGEPSP